MIISQDGLDFIKLAEGCVLKAYQDSVGIWTIGVGHTKGVCEGQVITQGMANSLLEDDLQEVYACIDVKVRVPLTQPQFDALCSFIFNLGCGAFSASTLRRKLNDGDYEGAAGEFKRWVHGGGRVLPGLVKRREGEAIMFASADPETTQPGVNA